MTRKKIASVAAVLAAVGALELTGAAAAQATTAPTATRHLTTSTPAAHTAGTVTPDWVICMGKLCVGWF